MEENQSGAADVRTETIAHRLQCRERSVAGPGDLFDPNRLSTADMRLPRPYQKPTETASQFLWSDYWPPIAKVRY